MMYHLSWEMFLIRSTSQAESKVFYLEMRGDYYRYLAGAVVGDDKKGIMAQSHHSLPRSF